MERGELGSDGRLALMALGGVFVVTVGWWALALWPVPGQTPEWLSRARTVCFNAGPDGMPDASGWLLLVGQPLGMFGFLGVVWSEALHRGLAWMWSRTDGRLALASVGLFALTGLVGAGYRVAAAAEARAPMEIPSVMAVEDHPRLDREAPPLELIDHRGEGFDLGELKGRPALVTFAFGHCPDICPLVVDNARRARDAVWGPEGGSLVVVTLDPWRDTVRRLPNLAERWAMGGPRDHLLSGPVEEVEAALDAWNVARFRDILTGDVAHPSLTYLLDADGVIVFATLSGLEILEGLAERL